MPTDRRRPKFKKYPSLQSARDRLQTLRNDSAADQEAEEKKHGVEASRVGFDGEPTVGDSEAYAIGFYAGRKSGLESALFVTGQVEEKE